MNRDLFTIPSLQLSAAVERAWLATVLMTAPAMASAACVPGVGPNTYTCTDTSDVSGTQTGETTLDAATNPVTLNVATDAVLANDVSVTTAGYHSTLTASGGAAVTINDAGMRLTYDPNTWLPSGSINMDRSGVSFDATAWTSDSVGNLFNNGVAAGVAAGIRAGSGPLTYTATYGSIVTTGDFTAGIYGNAPVQTINLTGSPSKGISSGIINNSYTFGSDTLGEGHWAIANYGGATFTAPTILDGTQHATNVSAGLTTINVDQWGFVTGDILVVDRNPLYMAAELANPGIALAYAASEVGPRDSIIHLGGDALYGGGGANVSGNFYFGSGEHHLTNIYANVNGNVYVDQRDTAVVDVVGGVAVPQYLVGGKKKFTLSIDGNGYWNGNLQINDTVGATNTVNIYGDNLMNFYALNGVGNNTLNFYCGRSYNHPRCGTSSDISGFTSVNIFGEGTQFALLSQGGGIHVLGDINVFNTDFIIRETLNAANVNISHDSSLNIDTDVAGPAINGNLNSAGAINLNDKTLHITGNMAVDSGSVINTTITGTGHGNIVVDGAGTVSNGATVILNSRNFRVHTGDVFTLSTNTTGLPTIRNDGLVRWTVSDATGDLILTANTNAGVTLPGLTPGAVSALNIIHDYTGTNTAFFNLGTALQGYTTSEMMRVGERLRPEINDGAFRTALGMTDKVLGLVESRLFESHLSHVYGMTGVPTGDEKSVGAGIWVQGFGFGGDQKSRSNVDGYTAQSTGLAFGADRLFGTSDRLRVGGALSYASSHVNNQGLTDNNNLNINSYFATAYASWADDAWYLNGAAGFGRQLYKTTRVPLVGMNNRGNRAGIQLAVKAEAGVPVRFNNELAIVPVASFSYNHFHEDAYQEAGSLVALIVDSRDTDSFRSGVGAKAIYSVQEDEWRADLELRAMWSHEFGSIDQDVMARFIAGGPSFASPSVKAARDGIVLGSSLRLSGDNEKDEISVLLSYDADFRAKYFGQALSMMLRYDFDQGAAYAKRAELLKSTAAARFVTAREKDIAEISAAMAPAPEVATALSTAEVAEQAIASLIDSWAAAWANKDVEKYLNLYAADFTGPGTNNHNAWVRKRKAQMAQESNLAVNISYLKVQAAGSEASAIFTQTLTENKRKDVSRKIVDLAERNGRWLIVSETEMPVTE